MKKVFAIIILLLNLINFSYGQIKIESGNLAYFFVEYQKLVRAGENISINLTAKDPFDNDISDFNGSIEVDINGIRKKINFLNGKSSLNFAETLPRVYKLEFLLNNKTIKIKDKYTNGLLDNISVEVLNGKIEKVDIITSPDFIPEYEKEIVINAYDKYGNLVKDTSYDKQELIVQLNGLYKSTIRNKEFDNGKKTLKIVPLDIKDTTLEIYDSSTRKLLGSKTLSVVKQIPSEVKINYPQKTKAGEEFEIILSVYDQNGLLIKVYDKIGKPIMLRHNGNGKLIPEKVLPEEFSKGIAKIKAIYTKNELINITPEIGGFNLNIKSEKNEFSQEDQNTSIVKKEDLSLKKIEEKTTKTPIKVVNLFVPKKLGTVSKIDIKESIQNRVIVYAYLENRDKSLDIVSFTRDLIVNDKKIGTIEFKGKNENIIEIIVNKDKKYNVMPVLNENQNLIKLEVY